MKVLKKLQALPVASLAEGALLGKIDDLQLDLESGRVYGFRLTKGVFSRSGGVAADAVTLLGRDLVYVRSEEVVSWGGGPRAVVEGRAWGSEYRGTRVMSRRGAGLGVVEDLVVALGPARVVALLLDGNRVVVYDERISAGRDAVILADPALAVPRPEGDEGASEAWARLVGPPGVG